MDGKDDLEKDLKKSTVNTVVAPEDVLNRLIPEVPEVLAEELALSESSDDLDRQQYMGADMTNSLGDGVDGAMAPETNDTEEPSNTAPVPSPFKQG